MTPALSNYPPGVTGSEPQITGEPTACDRCADGRHDDCDDPTMWQGAGPTLLVLVCCCDLDLDAES